jgi:hypothetical protein
MGRWSQGAIYVSRNPLLQEIRMASKNTSAPAQTTVRAPEGFRRVGSVANAGWFNMKKIGNTIKGVLEGMYQRKDELNPKGISKFFQIRLLEDCEVRMGKGEETQIVVAKAGEYVNLNYGPKTKDLEQLVPQILQGAEFQIYGVVAGDKLKLSGGRTMHNFEVFTSMTVAPKAGSDDVTDFEGSSDEVTE